MSELFGSKKFQSAIVGVILVIAEYLLFGVFFPQPEALLYLIPITAGLFGLQIFGQGLADVGKSKQQEHAKFVTEMQAKGAVINGPPPGPPPGLPPGVPPQR